MPMASLSTCPLCLEWQSCSILLKGITTRPLAKIFVCVCTQCLVLYVLLAKIKNRKILFIGKIRCVMHLTGKARVKFEVKEVSDHAMHQYNFTQLYRVMTM